MFALVVEPLMNTVCMLVAVIFAIAILAFVDSYLYASVEWTRWIPEVWISVHRDAQLGGDSVVWWWSVLIVMPFSGCSVCSGW